MIKTFLLFLLFVSSFAGLAQTTDSTKKLTGCPPISYLGKYNGKVEILRSEWNAFEPSTLLVKENCKEGVNYTILEYHATFKIKGLTTSFLGAGSKLYSHMIAAMKSQGISRIVFDEIKAKDSRGGIHKIAPIILTIK